MRIYAISLDHERCPLDIRERVAATVPGGRIAGRHRWDGDDSPEGWAVLSTCNRFEVVAHFESAADRQSCASAYRATSEYVSWQSGVSSAAFVPFLKRYGGTRAVEHLARVAAGLESAIIGEPEILGQVAGALREAERDGHASQAIRVVFRAAIRAGRRARAETSIGRGSASVATSIADIAAPSRDSSKARRIVIVGLGAVGRKVLHVLEDRGASIVVVSRSPATDGSAEAIDVRNVRELPALLADADAVVLATSSATPILTPSMIDEAAIRRRGRSLDVIDAGMPRNADPSVRRVAGVRLFDLQAITGRMKDAREGRLDAVADVEAIIAEEVAEFERWRKAVDSAAIIDALRRKAERIRQEEISRALSRWPGLTPEFRDALEHVSSAIVTKLLHDPTVTLRESGDEVRPARSRLLRDLFALTESG